jgi:phosphoribosyl-AMP cyclohydrolase
VFWSRSRGERWHKGATSGNTQRVVDVVADCDADVVLVRVDQAGAGACHTGRPLLLQPVERVGPRSAMRTGTRT